MGLVKHEPGSSPTQFITLCAPVSTPYPFAILNSLSLFWLHVAHLPSAGSYSNSLNLFPNDRFPVLLLSLAPSLCRFFVFSDNKVFMARRYANASITVWGSEINTRVFWKCRKIYIGTNRRRRNVWALWQQRSNTTQLFMVIWEQWRTQAILFGGFNIFSWGQWTEGTGIWER